MRFDTKFALFDLVKTYDQGPVSGALHGKVIGIVITMRAHYGDAVVLYQVDFGDDVLTVAEEGLLIDGSLPG